MFGSAVYDGDRWYGRGKRAAVFGSFLVATYDAVTGKFSSVTKVGSGFTDAMLVHATRSLAAQQCETAPDSVTCPNIVPDVWFRPSEVSGCWSSPRSFNPDAVMIQGNVGSCRCGKSKQRS